MFYIILIVVVFATYCCIDVPLQRMTQWKYFPGNSKFAWREEVGFMPGSDDPLIHPWTKWYITKPLVQANSLREIMLKLLLKKKKNVFLGSSEGNNYAPHSTTYNLSIKLGVRVQYCRIKSVEYNWFTAKSFLTSLFTIKFLYPHLLQGTAFPSNYFLSACIAGKRYGWRESLSWRVEAIERLQPRDWVTDTRTKHGR